MAGRRADGQRGVDIPRLRVGVYATTTATELFFRQAVGRFVRWQAGRRDQKAYVFVPDDPRLRAHAFAIAEARRHVLRPPVASDDDLDHADQLDPLRAGPEQFAEQLSMFSAVSATATGAPPTRRWQWRSVPSPLPTAAWPTTR